MSKCSICNDKVDLDSGGVIGEMGIIPVNLCVWCDSSLRSLYIDIIEDEELFEDGELELSEVLNKIKYHLFEEGDWAIIRRTR
mgnify:CR=1 FL=1